MCRNIRPLFNFEPPATDEEMRDAALQYVRKISGMNPPSKANRATFDRAVDEVAAATRRLVEGLETKAPPRDREAERAKARRRWQQRAARAAQTATAVLLLLTGLGLVAGPEPAAADWLVLTDGTRVETRGGWEEREHLVVFTSADGKLTSLRATEVDLEASHRLTRAAVEAAERRRAEAERGKSEPPPKREPILVLGDGDVKSADPAVLTAIAERTARPRIVMFKTEWCGYCKKANRLLAELGVPFEERDIETSAAAKMEFDRRFGPGTGVPVIDVGGEILRGYNEDKLRRAVDALATSRASTSPAASSPSAAPAPEPPPASTPPDRPPPGRG